jgi:hypothetical protein
MTKDASFKKVVRRHAEETGQRYTEALTDLEGLGSRMDHEPAGDRLLVHLRDRYSIDAVAATKLSVHKTYVFRIDRNDGSPWIARAFPPARPRTGVEGDAAILRFLEQHGYPAERWRSTMRSRISTEARFLSPNSSKAGYSQTALRSSRSWVSCSVACMRCR